MKQHPFFGLESKRAIQILDSLFGGAVICLVLSGFIFCLIALGGITLGTNYLLVLVVAFCPFLVLPLAWLYSFTLKYNYAPWTLYDYLKKYSKVLLALKKLEDKEDEKSKKKREKLLLRITALEVFAKTELNFSYETRQDLQYFLLNPEKAKDFPTPED